MNLNTKSPLDFTSMFWFCILCLFTALGPSNISAQEPSQANKTLVEIADELLSKQAYQKAFDTLVYGLRQYDLSLNNNEIDAAARTRDYIGLLDVFTLRMFNYDVYGQYIELTPY